MVIHPRRRPRVWHSRDWVLLAPVLLPESLLYFLSSKSRVGETEVRHVYPRGEVKGIDVVLIMTHLRNIKDKKSKLVNLNVLFLPLTDLPYSCYLHM